MFIIGLQGCGDCHVYYKIHPEYTYVELRKNSKEKTSNEILEIKRALGKLNFDMKFPVLLTDDLKVLTPRSELSEELNKYKAKIGKCKTCGENK